VEIDENKRAVAESIFLAKEEVKKLTMQVLGVGERPDFATVRTVIEITHCDPDVALFAIAAHPNEPAEAAVSFILGNQMFTEHPFIGIY
jgi:hypothetical protein